MIVPVGLVAPAWCVMTMRKLGTGVLRTLAGGRVCGDTGRAAVHAAGGCRHQPVLKRTGEQCEQRFTPASTFKIPLSLMGYDSGFLTDEHLPAIPYRAGSPALDPSWKTTVDPTSWIKDSVVWYSQQITLWLGKERLQRYVTRFAYGNQDLAGNRA